MESFSFASDLAMGGVVFKDGESGGRSSSCYVYSRVGLPIFIFAYSMTEAYEERRTGEILLIFVLGEL